MLPTTLKLGEFGGLGSASSGLAERCSIPTLSHLRVACGVRRGSICVKLSTLTVTICRDRPAKGKHHALLPPEEQQSHNQ